MRFKMEFEGGFEPLYFTGDDLIGMGFEEGLKDDPTLFYINVLPDSQIESDYSFGFGLTTYRGQAEFCLFLPDRSTVYLCPKTLGELDIIIKSIGSWEPDW